MGRIKSFTICLALASNLLGCAVHDFTVSNKTVVQNLSRHQASEAPETKAQADDRPTETGAGVPGYLVDCSIIEAHDDSVPVGCRALTRAGTRPLATADRWTHFEVASPNNPAIQVRKVKPVTEDGWDVHFVFTGAPRDELQKVAQASAYSFNEEDKSGVAVTVANSPEAATSQAPSVQTCTNGVLVEGICFVSVTSSCTEYCSMSQAQVHPWVTSRYGSAAADKGQACSQLYENFSDRTPMVNLGILEVASNRGLGCHRDATGRILFDTTPTDPTAAPLLGYNRLCACK